MPILRVSIHVLTTIFTLTIVSAAFGTEFHVAVSPSVFFLLHSSFILYLTGAPTESGDEWGRNADVGGPVR